MMSLPGPPDAREPQVFLVEDGAAPLRPNSLQDLHHVVAVSRNVLVDIREPGGRILVVHRRPVRAVQVTVASGKVAHCAEIVASVAVPYTTVASAYRQSKAIFTSSKLVTWWFSAGSDDFTLGHVLLLSQWWTASGPHASCRVSRHAAPLLSHSPQSTVQIVLPQAVSASDPKADV